MFKNILGKGILRKFKAVEESANTSKGLRKKYIISKFMYPWINGQPA